MHSKGVDALRIVRYKTNRKNWYYRGPTKNDAPHRAKFRDAQHQSIRARKK